MKKQKPNSLKEYQKLKAENVERLKELAALNKTTQILKENKSIEETFQEVCMILPDAWQYPEFTEARIKFDGKEYRTPEFQETRWCLRQVFETIENKRGLIEVFYTKKFQDMDEGPFMKEEKHLIENLTEMLTGYLNSIVGKRYMREQRKKNIHTDFVEVGTSSSSPPRQLLQKFLNKNNYDRDIYHDLMPFKVTEILLVANLYDAYSIEKEGRFSEHVLGEYQQLNLSSIPRITGVSTADEAMSQLENRHFDLVILMMGVDKISPITLSSSIKRNYPYIPVFLLLNNNNDLEYIKQKKATTKYIDKVFVWNGESKVFFAMIKNVEDKINVENDTQFGMVRVILLVEDSPRYYSKYLTELYDIIMEQTKRIIDDVSSDELYKVLKLRARPKILHVENYEEAIHIIDLYKEYLLCLITDVEFERNGKKDKNAGIELVKYVRDKTIDLPIIIQSSEETNANKAENLKTTFINKNSETLTQDLKSFIKDYLGFGDFIFSNDLGEQIAIARSLQEFEILIQTIPEESLLYHAKKNHFSNWLMARGEIQVAKILNPQKASDFKNLQELRAYMLKTISKFRNEQNEGKIIPFNPLALSDERNVVSLMEGSLGGKGRGVAFINTLLYNYNFNKYVKDINFKAPKTSTIGTEEFDHFIESNHILEKGFLKKDYNEIKQIFLEAELSETLLGRLEILVGEIVKPLAVRSSGLFEDSLTQPFAGIFETYILPNSNPDVKIRLQQLASAVKLVFASTYSNIAQGYVEAINYSIDEERMAVVIQEVVGNQYGQYYYPHISGVAQSYNYYPISDMKPEEGFIIMAVGLGKYVVDGEKAYRFSPQYPGLEINSPKDQYKYSQVEFYAVDLNKHDINLLEGDTAGLARLDIEEAEKLGTLKHCASVYDSDNDIIVPGLSHAGPRIVNFADILKYDYIPLAKTIEVTLDVVKEAMGCPVEIEFAVDLNKDENNRASFYILQIKPLLGNALDYNINIEKIKKKNILVYSEKALGNGVIKGIMDVIYIDKDNFDKRETVKMAEEIALINTKMKNENRKYILIGPGRWGTRDPWIGIPVTWPQISNAKVIVETSLENFPLDSSSGSHFFHNVTSMNVGYFSVQPEISESYIKWDILNEQKLIDSSGAVKHISFNNPLVIKMDGRKRISVITVK